MNKTLELYDIYPKVVPVHKCSKITIKAMDYSVRLEEGTDYSVMVLPLCETIQGEGTEYQVHKVVAIDNTLVVSHVFGNEQEYYFRVLDEEGKSIVQLSVYALEEDLYECRPYKGDLHVHTCFSDGSESPEFVVAKYRQAGFDFLAITDHHRYAPSLRAIDAYKDVPLALKLFPGEEVHGLDNHIHIVNFGGDYSVNKIFQDDPELYYKEVKAIEETLNCPEGVNAFHYASCLWVYNQIKQGNGLGIFAHPHWIANVYHVRDTMSRYQMEEQPFDAFELIGGQSVKENNMQLAFYNEMRKKFGKEIPIVGSSDSHGVLGGRLFDEMKTVVIAKSNEKKDIIEAVKACHSVAIEHYNGEHYKVHGSYRLVSYVIFLMEHYFPLHDTLCYEEGRAMLDYIRGEEEAKDILALTQGRTAKMLGKYFDRYEG